MLKRILDHNHYNDMKVGYYGMLNLNVQFYWEGCIGHSYAICV